MDPETGEKYARDRIRQFEEEEAALRAQFRANGVPLNDHSSTESPSSSEDGPIPATSNGKASHSYFVGDSSGLGFLNSILSASELQPIRTRIMQQLAARPRMQRQHIAPSPLPPLGEAEALLNNYFSRFHIHHTFLLRQELLDIFNRLYIESENSISIQDRFRLFMVFAISATTRHRAGLSSEDPYGYFKAAEGYLGSIGLIKDIDAIQNLLLIARFGMYHHIGTSLWEISQLCMRQCIEWRLHVPRSHAMDPLSEQLRRRVFWDAYVLDRYSSGMLGRPFAIRENDILVGLPVDVDDETVTMTAAATLDEIPPNTSSRPTELSVFIHCIKLRQISSRIHTSFYTGHGLDHSNNHQNNAKSPRFKSIGNVYTSFIRFRSELEGWRMSSPTFQTPRSLYEISEWHTFLLEKDLMLLARGALHNIPFRTVTTTGVLKEIFMSCYGSAKRVIELYADLMDKGAITWTRSYFQVIFTAGLTVIYCLSFDAIREDLHELDPVQILEICHKILSFFKEKMPDAGSFAIAFELLKSECVKPRNIHEIGHRQSGNATPLGTSTHAPMTVDASMNNVDLGSAIHHPAMTDMQMPTYNDMPTYDFHAADFELGITDDLDLMTQLEAGLGEYAWGWIPMSNDFLDSMPFQ